MRGAVFHIELECVVTLSPGRFRPAWWMAALFLLCPAFAVAAADTRPPELLALEDDLLATVARVDPVRATLLGIHVTDHTLGPVGMAGLDARRAAWEQLDAEAAALQPRVITRDNRHDVALVRFEAAQRLYELDSLRIHTTDPGLAIREVARGISGVLGRDYAPLPDRAAAALGRLLETPDYLGGAYRLLERPSRVEVELAIEHAGALAAYLVDGVPLTLTGLQDPVLRRQLDDALTAALHAVWRYRERLVFEQLPRAEVNAAWGSARLEGWLAAAEGIDIPLDTLRVMAERELVRWQDEFDRAAVLVAGRSGGGLSRVRANHPRESELLDELRRAVAEASAFTLADGIVPWVEGDLVVRGIADPDGAVARLSAPGRLEDAPQPAVLTLAVPGGECPEFQRDQHLQFLNRELLANLAVHEAYPGHFVHARRIDVLPRLVRRVVLSSAFSEGWAHYCETLMLERGYRADRPGFRMVTAQSALRRAGRLRVALGLHTEGWSVERAIEFLQTECRLQPAIARREAERGVTQPLYLVYTVGRLAIEDMRAQRERTEGIAFDLREFHEELLGLGAPPLPLARERMLGRGAADAEWSD